MSFLYDVKANENMYNTVYELQVHDIYFHRD